MKQLLFPTVACVFALVGCGVSPSMVHPSRQPIASSNVLAVSNTPKLPSPPAGMNWYAVTVDGHTYDLPAKTQQDTQRVGLLVATNYGVAWANPIHPSEILLSPPGTTVLDPNSAKVIFTFTLPTAADKSVYSCATGWFDVSPDAPQYLFFGGYVFKTSDNMVGTWNIYAFNLKTREVQSVVKNVRTSGGYLFSVAWHSHYFIYDQASPTATDYTSHVHVVDLNTGQDTLVWAGEHDKMPALKITLDDGTFTPVWTQYGTQWTQTEPE